MARTGKMKRSIQNIPAFIYAILLVLLQGPFWVWPLLRLPHAKALLSVLFALLCYKYFKPLRCDTFLLKWFALITLIFTIKTPNPILSLFCFLPLLTIPFADNNLYKDIFHYFENIIALLLVLALISWILYLLGFIGPMAIIPPLVELKEYNYAVYGFCVGTSGMLYESIRFCGPFDEPGVVGTLCAILLSIHNYKLNSYKSWIFIISGIFSLSFFFFLITGIFCCYYYVAVKKKFFPLVIMATLLGGLYFYTKDDTAMYNTIWRRFEWNSEENTLKGDTRTNYAADRFYDSKKGTINFWIGLNDHDYQIYQEAAEGSSSYKNIVMCHGMIFMAGYALFFALYGYNRRKNMRSYWLYLFVLFGCLYQRTNIYDPVTMFLFIIYARSLSDKQIVGDPQQFTIGTKNLIKLSPLNHEHI